VLHRRLALILVLACALVMRMAVPSGWMPVANAHGSIELAPCPSAGPVKAEHTHHDHHSGSPKQDHKGKAAADCAFAPLHAGLDVWVDPPASLLGLSNVELVPRSRSTANAPTGPPSPPPPSTGPPLIA